MALIDDVKHLNQDNFKVNIDTATHAEKIAALELVNPVWIVLVHFNGAENEMTKSGANITFKEFVYTFNAENKESAFKILTYMKSVLQYRTRT